MGIDNVSNQNSNYDNIVIKIEDNQGNEQQVKLSLFVEGMAIAADTQSALSVFDTNKDGKISSNEAFVLKKVISDYAGSDKTLDDKEILKIFNTDSSHNSAAKILKQFKTMVERQFKGKLATTVQTTDGRKITSDFSRDGSGTTVTEEKNGTVTTCTYDTGKILRKKEIVDSEGKKTTIEYDYDDNNKLIKTTTKLYNKIGRLKESKTVKNNYNQTTGKLESSETMIKTAGKPARKLTTTYNYDAETGKLTDEVTEEILGGKPMVLPNGQNVQKKKTTNVHYDYDANGKVSKKTTTKSPEGIVTVAEFQDGKLKKQTTTEHRIAFKIDNGKLIPAYKDSSSVMEYFYHDNGNKQSVTFHSEDSYGKATDAVYRYDENGKMTYATKSYFQRGAYVEEKYEGANLENRVAGSVASEIIIYEDAEKTKIKQKIVNIFDEDGILIGDEIYDGDGNKIAEHDFSKLDGKFDTAYQKGRGDCYLLAAINSLASSEAGAKLLEDKIAADGDNFIVKLPGAKIAREQLIKDLKAKDPNFDESKIDIPDEYTITADELKQAMLKSGSKYSIGDKDVLLMEIAYERYRESVAETLDENNLKPSDYMKGLSLNINGDDYLSSGTTAEAIFIMTGKTSEVYITQNMDNVPVCYIDSDFQMHVAGKSGELAEADTSYKAIAPALDADKKQIIEKLKKATVDGTIQNYAATASFIVSSQEVNGKVIKNGNHAFTIKSVTDEQVILANPWNPDVDVVMSMDDFLKSAFRIQIADLNNNESNSGNGGTNVNNGNINGNNNNGGVSVNEPPAPSIPENQNENHKPNYKVPKGKGFITLMKEKLIEQGIRPTRDNIQKAKAQFKAANPGAVKVYNGSKQEWKGNEYLLQDAEVFIPQFKTDEAGNVL